jgi:hypothetical protein
MNKEHFRLGIGVSVILVHAACFLLIFYAKDEYLSPRQKIDVALLFMPITAAYVVAVVRTALDEGSDLQFASSKVSLNYLVIVTLITAICLLGLLWTVHSLTGNSETDRQQIIIFEIVFGASFGLVAADLFGKVERVVVPQQHPDADS